SGLTQGQLAQQTGVARRTVQDWESGVNRPTAERMERVLVAMLEAGGLAAGQEVEDAQAFWDALQQSSSRTYPAFDKTWFDRLVAERVRLSKAAGALRADNPAQVLSSTIARHHDWGDAPDPSRFIGRTEELTLLRQWLLDDHCRLVA